MGFCYDCLQPLIMIEEGTVRRKTGGKTKKQTIEHFFKLSQRFVLIFELSHGYK